MKRREFITLLGGAAAPGRSRRTRSSRQAADHRVSWARAPLQAQGPWVAAFVQRLRELGWIEGRTVAIEFRWAEGRTSALPISWPSSFASKSMSLSRSEAAVARGKAGDIGHPDRLRGGGGPGWHRLGCKSGAAGRQHHRPVDPVSRSCCQASRTLSRGSFPVSAGWRLWPMSVFRPPCWRWSRFRQRCARSASMPS